MERLGQVGGPRLPNLKMAVKQSPQAASSQATLRPTLYWQLGGWEPQAPRSWWDEMGSWRRHSRATKWPIPLGCSPVHGTNSPNFQANSPSGFSQRPFPAPVTSSSLHYLWSDPYYQALAFLWQPSHQPVSLTPQSSPPIQPLSCPTVIFLRLSHFLC